MRSLLRGSHRVEALLQTGPRADHHAGKVRHQQQSVGWVRRQMTWNRHVSVGEQFQSDALTVDQVRLSLQPLCVFDVSEHDRRSGVQPTSVNRRRHSADESGGADDFVAYLDRVLAMSPYFNDKIDMRVGFQIEGPGGGNWSVDFRADKEGVFRDIEDCQYTYRFASRWLPSILSGDLPWEDFFLSLRFEAWRDPDLYNDHLLGLLKFAWPDALRAVRDYEVAKRDTATIDVRFEGVTYRIERFCAHAGQDLADTGEVLPGAVLRCLGHHYEFDLATGECLSGRSRPLSTEILEVDDRYKASPDGGAGMVTDPRTVDTA